MITVYDILTQYCKENNMPPASRGDLRQTGAIITTHFKSFWGVNQPEEVIRLAGFLFTKEPGMSMLVVGYPELFLDEMIRCIKEYYIIKSARIQNHKDLYENQPEKVTKEVTVTKRKRKAVPQKVWSAKPDNITNRNFMENISNGNG